LFCLKTKKIAFSHSIQHYTQQLVKDTNGYIKDLNAITPSLSQSEQRQRKMQRERLQDEFTATLSMFQTAQRSTAQKEKEQVNKAKAQAYGEPFLSK
jgi:syntaxin 7